MGKRVEWQSAPDLGGVLILVGIAGAVVGILWISPEGEPIDPR
jgi:hypothetical protein